MLKTSVRLLSLLSLLQSKPAWPGSELADRLGVTTRTVRNDIDRLRTLGYPVDGIRGAIGHYRLGAGATLPPLLLDDEEAVAVAIGLGAASVGAIERVAESSARALAKLEQVLPSRLRRQVSALTTTVTPVADDAAIPDPDPLVDPATLAAIANAIRDEEWLRFDTEDGPKTDETRTNESRAVEPYRLVSWERRWHLVARDIATGEWGTFRVDLMNLKMRTHRRFVPQVFPEGDLTRYVIRTVAFQGWKVHARVTVLASAEEVVSRINPAVGVVEAVDETTSVLVTGADSVETIAVYIGLLDLDIRITEPPELVERMRVLGRRYAAAVGPETNVVCETRRGPDSGDIHLE